MFNLLNSPSAVLSGGSGSPIPSASSSATSGVKSETNATFGAFDVRTGSQAGDGPRGVNPLLIAGAGAVAGFLVFKLLQK